MATLNPYIEKNTRLFMSEVQQTQPSILQEVNSKVKEHMNNFLKAPYNEDNVKKKIFSTEDLNVFR